ncbi:MAG: hypothetical protein ACR2KW_04855 [Rubrobacter sp.]
MLRCSVIIAVAAGCFASPKPAGFADHPEAFGGQPGARLSRATLAVTSFRRATSKPSRRSPQPLRSLV